MIIRLLVTLMMVLAIAKYYLHDTKLSQQTRPSQQLEDVQEQLDKAQQLQQERRDKQLEAMGLSN